MGLPQAEYQSPHLPARVIRLTPLLFVPQQCLLSPLGLSFEISPFIQFCDTLSLSCLATHRSLS